MVLVKISSSKSSWSIIRWELWTPALLHFNQLYSRKLILFSGVLFKIKLLLLSTQDFLSWTEQSTYTRIACTADRALLMTNELVYIRYLCNFMGRWIGPARSGKKVIETLSLSLSLSCRREKSWKANCYFPFCFDEIRKSSTLIFVFGNLPWHTTLKQGISLSWQWNNLINRRGGCHGYV